MSNYDVEQTFKQQDITPQQRNVLMYLSYCRNRSTGKCCPKDSTIAKAIGINERETRQVRRIRDALKQRGIIRWEKNGHYNSNQYDFHWYFNNEETGHSHPLNGGETGHPHPKTGDTTLNVEQEGTGRNRKSSE